MKELNIKNYAHIGDAVWELYIREKTVWMTKNLKKLHELTVSYVNAEFQTKMLNILKEELTEEENDLIRRAGNIKTSSIRKINRNIHRTATEFEVLIGYCHINNKQRLKILFNIMEPYIIDKN